jgi:nucleoid-associated protein YgaU
MSNTLSIHRPVKALTLSVLALAFNPAWAEKDTDYINALGDEAQITKMKDENAVPEKTQEPAVMPDKSTDVKKLTQDVTQKLQRVLGLNSNKTKGKKVNVANDLEKVVSSALEQGNSMNDIRSAVSEAMADLIKAQPKQTSVEAEALESASRVLNQIVGENKDAVSGKPEENYARSLNKQSVETPASIKPGNVAEKKPSTIVTKQVGSGKTIMVLKGESLYKISQRVYGNGEHYILLYKANRDIIINPDVIQIGQILKVPELP